MQASCSQSLSPLRAGVVGIGAFGRHHAAKYALMDQVELVGVADPCINARRVNQGATLNTVPDSLVVPP